LAPMGRCPWPDYIRAFGALFAAANWINVLAIRREFLEVQSTRDLRRDTGVVLE